MSYGSISSNNTPTNPLTITAPSGITDGDILVAMIATDVTSPLNITPPTGFVAVSGWPVLVTGDGGTYFVFQKTAASEAGNYTFTPDDSPLITGAIVRLTGISASGSLNRSSLASQSTLQNSPWTATAASYSTPTDATTTQLWIMFSDNHTTGTVTHAAPSGFTQRANNSDGAFLNFAISTLDSVASGAVGNLSGTGTQAGQQAGWACASLAFKEAGGGGGRTLFYRADLDGLSTSGPKQFNPSLG